jgi:VWFA-related protein
MRRLLKPMCVATSIFVVALASAGQIQNTSSAGEQQVSDTPQSKHPIRARVEEVVVPVTVIDKQGEFVLDLTQKDFKVFDKGVEQKINRFDVDADPLAVVLVVEANLRLQASAAVIQGMGTIFTETVMAESGKAAVLTYGKTADVNQPFTQDHEAIEQAIAGIQFLWSDSHLYDAMERGLELLREQPAPYRRILLVVGESQDSGSNLKLSHVLRDAQMANVAIYAIGPSTTAGDLRYGKGEKPGQRPPPQVKLPKLPPIAGVSPFTALAVWLLTRGTNEISNHQLEVAAAATGGAHYRAFHQETIRKALDRIGGELHVQYVLGYAPSTDPDEGFNPIRVDVGRTNIAVRARPGYYGAPD